jgi:hypothetical protein
MNYKEMERKKAIALLKNTDLFNHAESGRIIKDKDKDYPKEEILLDGINNIYEPIRQDVSDYFRENHICFWIQPKSNEPSDKPTGNLLSSQVCCINHLFPIRQDKEAVLEIIKTICPDFKDVLPLTTDKYSSGYIQFEAISDRDYLNEEQLTRGKKCTSVDALVYALHNNGKKFLIPIEWKYTESYGNEDKSIEDGDNEPKGSERKGKERLKRYSGLIDHSKFLKKLSSYKNSVYFYEPFYQLMRQTLWAEQMIEHKNEERIKADDYIHIHIIPKENVELLNKKYKCSNKTMEETWRENLEIQEKYKIITPQNLLQNIDKNKYCHLIQYLTQRYWNNNEF